jgi:hypothetical protein
MNHQPLRMRLHSEIGSAVTGIDDRADCHEEQHGEKTSGLCELHHA